MQGNEITGLSDPTQNSDSKGNEGNCLIVNPDSLQLLEGNTGRKLFGIIHSNSLLVPPS